MPRVLATAAGLLAALVCANPALGAPEPLPYGADDGRGFHDVLPSGTRGTYNAVELAGFLSMGRTVPHCCEQLPMYGDLVYATPGLQAADLLKYYKDATFGVKPEDVERRYSPRDDVTIVRDRQFGIPRIYGANRDGTMFGAGYAGAEDRLFFMDILRNAGRAQLSSFAGGANTAMDRDVWASSPYSEDDLQRQYDQLDDLLGPDGAIVQDDVAHYVAGINAYITEARLDASKLPGEYPALGHPEGPQEWKVTDVIATAALVGGIFGKGGGNELQSAEIHAALVERFGPRRGRRVFNEFRASEDPEAPSTVTNPKALFRYQVRPRRRAKGSVALPDPGSLKPERVVVAGTGSGAPERAARAGRGGLLAFPFAMSNALLISGAESVSGHPLMVAGPQTGYFNPQILMESELHAPAAPGKPGIDARGAAFNGVSLYIQLGRGRDYAWSATSAGQDNIDVFALELCRPDGAAPAVDSTHYRFRGSCEPMEVLERANSWQPSLGDSTPAGTQTLRAYRTKLGLVSHRATVGGKPVAFTRLRSTYFHEVDSAPGFLDFNSPERITGAKAFQRAAHRIGYTFNWFYADDRQIAFFNSGANPVRAPRVDPDFPVWGSERFEWRGWDPVRHLSDVTPFEQHPQVVDQQYLTNWNNKQARGYRASDGGGYSSVYRSQLLEDRIRAGIAGNRKLDLPGLVDIMEVAGSADLRAHAPLVYALRILGTPRDPDLRAAVERLRAWKADGGLRRDKNRDGTYEHSDAIATMDAWWPLWLRAQFGPRLGEEAMKVLERSYEFVNHPNNHGAHLGSAFQGSWEGHASKDLRTVLGRKVRGRYMLRYCGGGRLAACRKALEDSLREALEVDRAKLYEDSECTAQGKPGDQWCYDAIRQRPTGGATQPLIHWINRPTYQQANEIQGRAR